MADDAEETTIYEVVVNHEEPWNALTSGGSVLRTLPGRHFFLDPTMEMVVRSVMQDLP